MLVTVIKPAFKILSYILAIGVLVAAIWFLMVDSYARVQVNPAVQLDEADSVRKLMRQFRGTLSRRYRSQAIFIEQDQLNSLSGLLHRAHPHYSGVIELTPQAGSLLLSYQLPGYLPGDYINLSMTLLPSKGLELGDVTIGALTLPGDFALSMAEQLANWWTGSDIATQTLEQVERVQLYPERVRIQVKPLEQWLASLNTLKNGVGGNTDDRMRIATAHYLKLLAEMPVDQEDRNLPLTRYLSPLFAEARRRSIFSSPVSENEAAILALAIYTGHHRLANLVGAVQPVEGEIALPVHRPLLAGRADLTRHFVLSAAIKILSQQGISFAIGEFKELMDRAQGGSGYSFVDLAADMAGVNFATVATHPQNAATLQDMLADPALPEHVFFPDISNLPEQLDKKQFAENYGQLDSPAYRLKLAEIETRLNRLPLYNLDS